MNFAAKTSLGVVIPRPFNIAKNLSNTNFRFTSKQRCYNQVNKDNS
jgi:hypothetical protein